jgi:uncharacterized glyoxalase superfamily protein PhnB
MVRGALPMGRSIPVIEVSDSAEATEFYVDVLGFEIMWVWRHSPESLAYLQIRKEDLVIRLKEVEKAVPAEVYFAIKDVDEVKNLIVSKGIQNTGEVVEKPWKMRELKVIWSYPVYVDTIGHSNQAVCKVNFS